MTSQLRRVLLLLALLNLVFVQITGAVSTAWMVPLFALALGAPFLWRLQPLLVYRMCWNVALLAIFALLIVHVRRHGVRYMLEDGLILAAFCQVHVLNNLARQRRPDLIFFNSFLIALVTGFFCQDLVYSAVFLVYATVLVIGLRLASAAGVDHSPTRTLPDVELRGLVRGSLAQAAAVLLGTGLVFAFWPRDFEREGLVETELIAGAAASEVAFADEIRLDRAPNATRTNRIVMRARLERGTRLDVPAYWRGATFSNLQKHGWWADTNPQSQRFFGTSQLDPPWDRRGVGRFERKGFTTVATLDVQLTDPRIQHLFLPLCSHRVQFDCTAWPMVDGNFRVTGVPRQQVQVQFEVHRPGPADRVAGAHPADEYRQVPHRVVPDEARELADEIDRALRSRAMGQAETVEAIRGWLTAQREYLLPGEAGAVDNLRDFLAGRGGGHCEFFATTMVILLRLRSIPCRMVSGYLVHEWNEAGTEVVVRSDDAHAWVEVWDEERGWLTVDPTPAAESLGSRDASLLARTRDLLRSMWSSVTQFDEKTRVALLGWSRDRLLDAWAYAAGNPLRCALAVLGLVLLRPLLRRRREVDPAVRAYLGALRRARLELRPGETPRQLLARAAGMELPAAALERLRAATAAHEGARYGTG